MSIVKLSEVLEVESLVTMVIDMNATAQSSIGDVLNSLDSDYVQAWHNAFRCITGLYGTPCVHLTEKILDVRKAVTSGVFFDYSATTTDRPWA
jgi:hypothetical protein